jgi:FMN-dependent NADH-azoreductase
VEGLAKNKKMVIISSRGGDYRENSPFHSYDQLEPYLRTVLGFVGITDISFINAQPMDALGTEIMLEKIDAAKAEARELAKNL